MSIARLPRRDLIQLPMGAAALRAQRNIVTGIAYPHGLPTNGADVIEVDPAIRLPAGGARAIKYTFHHNGGWDVCSDMYAWVVEPTTTPRHKIAICCNGHAIIPYYWDDPELIFVMEPLLAEGWHILGIDMPEYGRQPSSAFINIDGARYGFSAHVLPEIVMASVDPDPIRWFLDYIIRGTNQAIADYGLNEVSAIQTFSGSGPIGQLLQTIDQRIQARYTISGYHVPSRQGLLSWFGPEDAEGWMPAIRTALGGRTDVLEVTSVLGGRRAVEVFLDIDDHSARGFHEMIDLWLEVYEMQLLGDTGTVRHWFDPTSTQHEVTVWAGQHIAADILAHT